MWNNVWATSKDFEELAFAPGKVLSEAIRVVDEYSVGSDPHDWPVLCMQLCRSSMLLFVAEVDREPPQACD